MKSPERYQPTEEELPMFAEIMREDEERASRGMEEIMRWERNRRRKALAKWRQEHGLTP